MEKNTFQLIFMVSLVLGLLFSQSTACFGEGCYKDCHHKCVSKGSKDIEACIQACLNRCNSPTSVDSLNVKNTRDFCQLGCVSSLCATTSTKQNPGDEEKLKGCIGYCSKTCSRNYNQKT